MAVLPEGTHKQGPKVLGALLPILQLARVNLLTAYDATDLHLALHEGLPLAILDGEMIAAVRRVGLPELAWQHLRLSSA